MQHPRHSPFPFETEARIIAFSASEAPLGKAILTQCFSQIKHLKKVNIWQRGAH